MKWDHWRNPAQGTLDQTQELKADHSDYQWQCLKWNKFNTFLAMQREFKAVSFRTACCGLSVSPCKYWNWTYFLNGDDTELYFDQKEEQGLFHTSLLVDSLSLITIVCVWIVCMKYSVHKITSGETRIFLFFFFDNWTKLIHFEISHHDLAHLR